MFVGPLFIGVIFGLAAGAGSLSLGYPIWLGLAFYMFGGAAAAMAAAMAGCAFARLRTLSRAFLRAEALDPAE